MNKEYIEFIVGLGKLTSRQYRCLLLLNTGEYTQADLSRILKTDRANINRALNALQEFGLIEESNKISNKILYRATDNEYVVSQCKASNIELLNRALDNCNKKYNCNFKLGAVTKEIDNLEKSQIYKIIQNLTGDYTDVKVYLGKKAYIVEVSWITDTPDGDEVDFIMKSIEEYENQYGRKFEEN